MILGSHNSWSYLPPKKWYMKPFRFIAQCLDLNIFELYDHGVRMFDLRVRYNGDTLQIVHGSMVFDIGCSTLLNQLKWLDSKGDVWIRVIHDVRTNKQYKQSSTKHFINDCSAFEKLYPNIKFFCGQNLYNRNRDYNFNNHPVVIEKYSSVVLPKYDDIYPRYYAKKYNKSLIKKYVDSDFLMLDFVNYK